VLPIGGGSSTEKNNNTEMEEKLIKKCHLSYQTAQEHPRVADGCGVCFQVSPEVQTAQLHLTAI